KACRDAQKSLKKVLGTADDLPLPDLANMKKGKPLGHFLLDKRLVHALDSDEGTLRGEWINKLMNQIGEVQEKLRRIHFKSLGGLLLWRAGIDARGGGRRAARPGGGARPDGPAGGKPVGTAVPLPPTTTAKPATADVVRRDREQTAAQQAAAK